MKSISISDQGLFTNAQTGFSSDRRLRCIAIRFYLYFMQPESSAFERAGGGKAFVEQRSAGNCEWPE
jgi:hypothetical protein